MGRKNIIAKNSEEGYLLHHRIGVVNWRVMELFVTGHGKVAMEIRKSERVCIC